MITLINDFILGEENLWGNSLNEYGIALLILIGCLAVFKIFQAIIIARLHKLADKTKTDIDDMLIGGIKSIKANYYLIVSLWITLHFLSVHNYISQGMNVLIIVFTFYQVVKAIDVLINFWAEKRLKHKDSKKTVDLVSKLAKGALYIIGALLILSNLGVNVNSLIAGLGIGGVAIALASQKILGDLFSSFAIYFDRPFQIGDLIEVDKVRGTVRKIGIKTTRLRAITGEEIGIANTKLTNARIHNYKKMKKRFVRFSFGVHYNTAQEKIEKIPKIIEEIVKPIKLAEFERAHFKEFGDSALLFDVAYNLATREFSEYLDNHQKILLAINKKFAQEKIEMAYPTQTINLNKS